MDSTLLKEAIVMANSNMCRLCLSANGITEPITYDQRDQFLLQKIYECTSLQIQPLNGIPSALCTICRTRLDEFYQFRWQCLRNDEIIKRIASNMQKPEPASKPESDLQITRIEGPTNDYPANSSHPIFEQQPNIQITRIEEPSPNPHVYQTTQQNSQYTPAATPNIQSLVAVEISTRDLIGNFGGHQVTHSYENDFKRKRGRPPKQKYEQFQAAPTMFKYHDQMKSQNSTMDCSEGSTVNEEHFHESGDHSQEFMEHKIKMEHNGEPIRYEYQRGQNSDEGHHESEYSRRPRGRPPKDGGYLNQDNKDEYRFQCQYCDAKFRAAINLKLHTNTHTGERPYKCQICDKAFAHPSNLSVHTKLHTLDRVKKDGVTSDKKYQCPYCHTLFSLAFQLKIHINTHTGEKPYQCKSCGKSFAQPSNLHVHSKKHCHKRQDHDDQHLLV